VTSRLTASTPNWPKRWSSTPRSTRGPSRASPGIEISRGRLDLVAQAAQPGGDLFALLAALELQRDPGLEPPQELLAAAQGLEGGSLDVDLDEIDLRELQLLDDLVERRQAHLHRPEPRLTGQGIVGRLRMEVEL